MGDSDSLKAWLCCDTFRSMLILQQASITRGEGDQLIISSKRDSFYFSDSIHVLAAYFTECQQDAKNVEGRLFGIHWTLKDFEGIVETESKKLVVTLGYKETRAKKACM